MTQNVQMTHLLCYIVIKQAFEYKTKVFAFKGSLNRGIHLSPSEMNVRNSVLQVQLARIHLIKECVIYNFEQMISPLFGAC